MAVVEEEHRELAAKEVSLSVGRNASLWGLVAPEYVSYTMDWWSNDTTKYPSWGNSSILNADLSNPRLQQLAASLSPAFLRIGGSQADTILYHPFSASCPEQHCLTMERWKQVLDFAHKVGARIVFCLNYLSHTEDENGKRDMRDWDSTTARQFLNYTFHHSPSEDLIYGFELGNELTHGSKATNTTRMRIAFEELRSIIDNIWRDTPHKPKVMGPAATGGGALKELLKELGPSLDVVTYHKYHGKGGSADLGQRAIQPQFFSHPFQFHDTSQAALKYFYQMRYGDNREQPYAPLWIGEGAMAYNSGRENVTDSMLSSFWYANLLGVLSKTRPLSHSVYCRQALIGGNYELIRHDTLEPNPDYWVARLWKELVGVAPIGPIESPGRNAPSYFTWGCCKEPGKDTLLVHAFCARPTNGTRAGDVTLVMINFGKTRYSVNLPSGTFRSEYTITAAGALRQSRKIRINNRSVSGDHLSFPRAITRDRNEPVFLARESISFVVVHGAEVNACMDLYHKEPAGYKAATALPSSSSNMNGTEYLPKPDKTHLSDKVQDSSTRYVTHVAGMMLLLVMFYICRTRPKRRPNVSSTRSTVAAIVLLFISS